MAYDVYTLSGFILQIRESGEFDKNLVFFSKERGLINIKAISAGKSTSKMRGFLIRFCFLDIDVVHGKTGYRLTRARTFDNGFLIHKKESYFLLSKFEKLITLLLPPETSHVGVFSVFCELMQYIETNIVTDSLIDFLYYKYALLALAELGYRENKDLSLDTGVLKKEYDYILYENGILNVI